MLPDETRAQPSAQNNTSDFSIPDDILACHQVFNLVNDAMFLWRINPDSSPSHFFLVNDAACILTGYTRDELLHLSPLNLTVSELQLQVLENLRSIARQQNPGNIFEWAIITRDGTRLPVEISEKYVRQDQGILVVSIIRDISRQKHESEELFRKSEELRLITTQLPAELWTVDKDLCFTSYFKSRHSKITIEPEELIGKDFYWLLKTDDPSTPAIAAHLQALEGTEAHYELHFEGVDFTIAVEPLRDKHGTIIGAISVSLDITSQKQLERELKAKNRELDDFTYMVSHDLRSPLNLISGFLGMVKEEHQLLETVFPKIDLQLSELHTMIGSLLKLSRAGRVIDQAEDVDLCALFRELILKMKTFEPAPRISMPEMLPTIKGDRDRLFQVFLISSRTPGSAGIPERIHLP